MTQRNPEKPVPANWLLGASAWPAIDLNPPDVFCAAAPNPPPPLGEFAKLPNPPEPLLLDWPKTEVVPPKPPDEGEVNPPPPEKIFHPS